MLHIYIPSAQGLGDRTQVSQAGFNLPPFLLLTLTPNNTELLKYTKMYWDVCQPATMALATVDDKCHLPYQ